VSDKPINEVTNEDGMDYFVWWSGRVFRGETNAKTANKEMGQLSRMLKDVSIRRRLNLPDIFKGLRVRGEEQHTRCPYETDFIQNRLLASGAPPRTMASSRTEQEFQYYTRRSRMSPLRVDQRFFEHVRGISALPPISDVLSSRSKRRSGPKPDSCTAAKPSFLLDVAGRGP
jgi:hypothetical protein